MGGHDLARGVQTVALRTKRHRRHHFLRRAQRSSMRLLPALFALGTLGVTAFGDGALSRFSGAVNKKDRGARARTASANATEEVRGGGGVRATTIKYDKTDHIIDRAIRPVFAGVAAGLEAFTAASNEATKTSVVIDVKAVPGDVHIIESERARKEKELLLSGPHSPLHWSRSSTTGERKKVAVRAKSTPPKASSSWRTQVALDDLWGI